LSLSRKRKRRDDGCATDRVMSEARGSEEEIGGDYKGLVCRRESEESDSERARGLGNKEGRQTLNSLKVSDRETNVVDPREARETGERDGCGGLVVCGKNTEERGMTR